MAAETSIASRKPEEEEEDLEDRDPRHQPSFVSDSSSSLEDR